MPDETPRQYRLMTLEEVAVRVGRHVRLLRRWAAKGRIPAEKVGGVWIVNAADIPLIEAMPRTRGRRPRKVESQGPMVRFVPDDDPEFQAAVREAALTLTTAAYADSREVIEGELRPRYPRIAVVEDPPLSEDAMFGQPHWTVYRDGKQ